MTRVLLVEPETQVRSALKGCLEANGDTATARAQYEQVLAEYPDTQYAAQARRAVERL